MQHSLLHPLHPDHKPDNGFTLVELAISIMIIGLLIGGILQAQSMVVNSKATAVIAQIRGYQAAVSTFKDVNSAWPGDLATAAARIPGCNQNCTPFVTGRSNDIVGTGNWAETWDTQTSANPNIPAASENDETTLFWVHLLLSGLIGGVNDKMLHAEQPVPTAWGETHPASPIGGGYIIGYGNGTRLPGDLAPPPSPGSPAAGPNGMILLIVSTPRMGGDTEMVETGLQPMTASMAGRIDDKIDDGLPSSGHVMAYGNSDSCFGGDGTNPFYNGSINASDCGLSFLISK